MNKCKKCAFERCCRENNINPDTYRCNFVNKVTKNKEQDNWNYRP